MSEVLRRLKRNAGKAVEEPVVKKAKPALKKEVKPAVEIPAVSEKEPKTKAIDVGDKIPDLTLLDEEDNDVSLTEIASKNKYLVIFAYPKASTPGCTRQVCGFQALYDDFKGLDAAVYGISSDLPKSQKNFVTKQKLAYPLLLDPQKKLIGPLGAKKSPLGIKRSHWIFVDGVLKVKKVGISPEESFKSAKLDIEAFEKEEPKKEE